MKLNLNSVIKNTAISKKYKAESENNLRDGNPDSLDFIIFSILSRAKPDNTVREKEVRSRNLEGTRKKLKGGREKRK